MDDYGPFSTAEAKDVHGFYVCMSGAVCDVPAAPKLHDPGDSDRALDRQVGGDHYKQFKIQPVEFIMANNLDFCSSNAVKYICRHKVNGGRQDLEKARHYIDMLIELEYGK